MTNPVAIWHAEHVRFASLLDFFEQQMIGFHEGNDPDYELMRDIVHYLHNYADRYHHPREDAAFHCLVKRSPGLRPAVLMLLQEHRVLAAVGETLLHYLEDILADTVIERETVEAAAATYLVYYRHHLTMEEREILPRADQILEAEDWAAVAAAVAAVPDPLYGDNVSAAYRALRKRITAQAYS